MLRGGVQATLHPNLPLLPPGKASALAIASTGDGATSTLKVCLPQQLVAAGACAGPPSQEMTGRAGQALEIIWCGALLTDGELGGGEGNLKAEEARLTHSWGLQTPPTHPRVWPAAFTFILNLGDYRVQRLVALSVSPGCSTLGLHMLAV